MRSSLLDKNMHKSRSKSSTCIPWLAAFLLVSCTAVHYDGQTDNEEITGCLPDVTDATFAQQVLSAKSPVLVDFYATWCKPCKKMVPVLEELSSFYRGKVTFLKLDTDKNPRTGLKYGVNALPTFKIFKNGKEASSWEGMTTKENLKEWLQRTVVETPNRLIHEHSPYLLEHARDPVDWYPWSTEAFAKAERENKPVMLSVGYSACHWCHVMQKESFQNAEIARLLNDHFVSIKVDREERPDLDDIYMRATQALTGGGGWPMTVFLAPDKKPFFAGTYFPPSTFKAVLRQVQKAWDKDRGKLNEASLQLSSILKTADAPVASSSSVSAQTIKLALDTILKHADPVWGGIGQSPKFPLPGLLTLCLRTTTGTSELSEQRRNQTLAFLNNTLDKMAYGGIYDQVGGGFGRYSVDRQWRVPHFEKMLYDNALLANVYLEGYLVSHKGDWANVARRTLDFILRDLRSPEGPFYSSFDADSAGEEGAYYVFSYDEIEQALGNSDTPWFAQIFTISKEGNFHNHKNVLAFADSPEALASRSNLSTQQFWNKLNPMLKKLALLRDKRKAPNRDEKILVSWNSLTISALVQGYKALNDEKYLHAATKAAHFLISKAYVDHRLCHSWSKKAARNSGYLEDYAYTVQSLLDLASVDPNPVWLAKAQELNQVMLDHYHDPVDGGFFSTSDEQEQTITRPRSSRDAVNPSGTAVAVLNLIRLARLTHQPVYAAKAEHILKMYREPMQEDPVGYAYLLTALDLSLRPETQIVFVSDSSSQSEEMRATIFGSYLPHTTLLVQGKNQSAAPATQSFTEQSSGNPAPVVYLCRGKICEKAITDPLVLKERLKQLSNPAFASQN